ncbi:MAG: 3-hydroxybutyryl-CoA dehydrogenase [Cryomorphaceae bacterium]|nr:3-hydroxybutyryl-CoA dehydrogenase [Cryomorphaceae bacterium]
MKVSVIGAGTMGAGIAQIAATNGHKVCLYDSFDGAIETAETKLKKILNRLVEKERITQQDNEAILGRINFTKDIKDVSGSGLVIEAIIENLEIKQKVFTEIESLVDENCIIASNTSSLSIASIAAACEKAERVVGIHFFNPAPLMPLVEIIPSVQTSESTLTKAKAIINSWKKITVIAKDTPGFIVNRVARPFYGEALRIYEEGVADFATIDWAMREIGGFRMGPFQLMDYIGNDINYTVTETVFTAFYFDPRYKPSFTQKRMMEAGYLGRKSGRGYYDYSADTPNANEDRELGKKILWRILAMLINEAADALFLNIATKEDIDLSMTKGVNYPKGLLAWADEIGIKNVLSQLEDLQAEYGEDRYRPSPLLKQMVRENKTFY